MKTRANDLYIYDILECCQKIDRYLTGLTKQNFEDDPMVQDAVVRNIEIIGEASKCLSDEFRDQKPNIEWREIMRMRDKIIHHYFKIDLALVWETAKQDIPNLALELQNPNNG